MDVMKSELLNGWGTTSRYSAIGGNINTDSGEMERGMERNLPTKLSTGYPQFQGLTNPDGKRVGGLVESYPQCYYENLVHKRCTYKMGLIVA